MSGAAVLDALLGPSFEAGRRDSELVVLYTRRLLEFGRGPIYGYLQENSGPVLGSLQKNRQKADFVLGCWRISPPEHWEGWAHALPGDPKRSADAHAALEVVIHMLATSAELEPEAIRSVVPHVEVLGALLGTVSGDENSRRLCDVAREAFEQREWWIEEGPLDTQAALHELVRAIERLTPALAPESRLREHPLQGVRHADISRAPLQAAGELKGMRRLAVGLSVSSYAELWGRIPEASVAEQPELYAERVVSLVVLEERERGPDASSELVARYMKELDALVKLGTAYRPRYRMACVAMIGLQPRPHQLRRLIGYLGARPEEDAIKAGARWADRAERKDITDALTRLISPTFRTADWAAPLSGDVYTEAPVIRALSERLLKPVTNVRERERMAALTRKLTLRTQNGRDQLADLIVKMLAKGRPKEDLRVALVLCEGLGPEHQRQAKLRRAFVNYAKERSYRFTPAELRSIGAVGVEVPEKYLSKNAARRAEDLLAESRVKMRSLGKLIGL